MNSFPATLANRLAAHEASGRSDSPSSDRATAGTSTPGSDSSRNNAGFPFGRDESPNPYTTGRPNLLPADSNRSSNQNSAFSSRATTMSTMGDASPSLDRTHMVTTPLDADPIALPGRDEAYHSPTKTPHHDSANSPNTVRGSTLPPPSPTPVSPIKGINDRPSEPTQSPSKTPAPATVRTPSQTRPPITEKKSVLGKLFPGKEEKKEREREREQKKQQQLQDQRDRAAANGLTSEDSGAESESSEKSKGFGRIGRRMSSTKNGKEQGESLSRPPSREDGGKLERKASQSKEGGTSLRDLVANSMTRKMSTTSYVLRNGASASAD